MATNNTTEVRGVKLQDPDEQLKPKVTLEHVRDFVLRLYGIKALDIKNLPSYSDLNFFFRKNDADDNEHDRDENENGYVLKILNSLQSSIPDIIDPQHSFQLLLREKGITTQVPILNKNGEKWSLETFNVEEEGKMVDCGPYIVRVLNYLPGEIFANTPYVSGSFYNIGKFVGNMHQSTRDFHHSFYDTFSLVWSLLELPRLRNFIHDATDKEDAAMVREVIAAYENGVVPLLDKFTKGVIHGDLNVHNIITREVSGQDGVPSEKRVHEVSALLDFSDVTQSYYVMDVAICIASICNKCPDEDQLDVGGHVLAGYFTNNALNETEVESLKTLICARLCQSLVFSAHSFMQQPENTYVLKTRTRGWPLLRKIWKTDKADLYSKWTSIMNSYK